MYPKTILITGANRGIGLEFVKQLLRLHEPPTHIFAACRSPEKAEDLKKISAESPAVKVVKLDLGNLETVKPLADEVEKAVGSQGLNVLINNAGIYQTDCLGDISAEHMRESYEVNVVAPMLLTQTFLPLMKRASESLKESRMSCSHAAVVNISSGYGSIGEGTSKGIYPYKCSKAALNMMTKILSNDLRDHGILVVSFCPGWVKTDLGGPNAPVSTELSIEGMIDVMSRLTEKDTGTFRSFNGRTILW